MHHQRYDSNLTTDIGIPQGHEHRVQLSTRIQVRRCEGRLILLLQGQHSLRRGSLGSYQLHLDIVSMMLCY